jgi:hypothetical protein
MPSEPAAKVDEVGINRPIEAAFEPAGQKERPRRRYIGWAYLLCRQRPFLLPWPAVPWILWTVAFVAVSARLLLSASGSQDVFPVFSSAAQHWYDGEGLYIGDSHTAKGGQNSFLYPYSPLIAALLTPFHLVPDRLGCIVWRLINLSFFLGSFCWWLRSITLLGTSLRTALTVQLLLLLPLALGNLNNGQTNPLILGLLLVTVTAFYNERWNLAAVSVAFAGMFKVYPLALGLLLAVSYPLRFAPRLAIALVSLVLLTFCFQTPEYVAGQYLDWLHYLAHTDRSQTVFAPALRDLRLLFQVYLTPLSPSAFMLTTLAVALALACLCVWARFRSWPRAAFCCMVLGASTCWMTVFGPATESCTYILIAPTAVSCLWIAWYECRSAWARGLVTISFGLMVAAQLANWFPHGNRWTAWGQQPIAGLLLLASLLSCLPRRGFFGAQGSWDENLVGQLAIERPRASPARLPDGDFVSVVNARQSS